MRMFRAFTWVLRTIAVGTVVWLYVSTPQFQTMAGDTVNCPSLVRVDDVWLDDIPPNNGDIVEHYFETNRDIGTTEEWEDANRTIFRTCDDARTNRLAALVIATLVVLLTFTIRRQTVPTN